MRRMPAEFERHATTWMIWPERLDNWRQQARPAQQAYAQVAHAIADFEPVRMIVSDAQRERARATLDDHIELVAAPSNDAWARDVGATFVVGATGGIEAIDWPFNAWGGLYDDFRADDRIAALMAAYERCSALRAPVCMEGGSIHVDGEGTLITTAACLLDPQRNPGRHPEEIEAVFGEFLGVSKVIWLEQGLPEDETGGHIDNLLAFAAPGHVVLSWCDDPADPQYDVSHDAYERLSAAVDARGRRLRITKLPMPGPLFVAAEEVANLQNKGAGGYVRQAGDRLAASYANFYVANACVIMPLLDPATDAVAAGALREAFPSRRVIGIESREILLGGGNIHCITQQVPETRR